MASYFIGHSGYFPYILYGVTAVGVTVVLSVVFLPEFCGLHVIQVTNGIMQCIDIDPDNFLQPPECGLGV